MGAVEDAKEMENYVKTNFPSSHIRTLHNYQATRSSIVGEMLSLIHNNNIKHQDPILIYYAGHGGEAEPPTGSDIQGQKIQVFVPYDYDHDRTVITDMAFAMLLEELAWAKGDNIVGLNHVFLLHFLKPPLGRHSRLLSLGISEPRHSREGDWHLSY
jgi:hypothetical protein